MATIGRQKKQDAADRRRRAKPLRQSFPLPLPDGTTEEKDITSKDRFEFGLRIAIEYYERGCLDAYIEERKAKYRREQKTFKQVAEEWYMLTKEKAIRRNTQISYKGLLNNHLYPTFGDESIASITLSDLRMFFNGRGLQAKGTNDKCKIILKGVFAYAEENGLIKENPMNGRKIVVTGKEQAQKRALTMAQITSVLEVQGTQDATKFIAIGLLTGMRKGEIYGLRWEDVDMKSGQIHVTKQVQHGVECTPKTKAGVRDVPILPMLGAILEQRRGLPHAYVIGNGIAPITKARGQRIEREAKRITGVTPHEMRHTFVTVMTESGVDAKTLAEIVGHTDIGMTSRYTHPSAQLKAAAMAKLGVALTVKPLDIQGKNDDYS